MRILTGPTDASASLVSYLENKCRQAAGRMAVLVFLTVFAWLYLYGIATYGLLAGIGLGWLPAGLIAWCFAMAAVQIATLCFEYFVFRQSGLR